MSYDEKLVERVRKFLPKAIEEKKMFGGLSFLFHGKMFCGILKDDLVVRINKNDYEKFVSKPYVRPMDFTGKPMKGFLYVSSGGYKEDKELKEWIEVGFRYVLSLNEKKNK